VWTSADEGPSAERRDVELGDVVFALASFTMVLFLGIATALALARQGIASPLARAYVYVAAPVMVWNLGYTLMFLADDAAGAEIAYRIGSPGWAILPSAALYFVWELWHAWKTPRIDRRAGMLAFLPSIYFILHATRGEMLATGFEKSVIGWAERIDMSSPQCQAYVGMAFASWAVCATMLFLLVKRAKLRKHRYQAYIVVIPGLLAGTAITIVNVLLPGLGIHAVPVIGHLVAAAWIVIMGLALQRYPILTVTPRLAAVEIADAMSDTLILADAEGRILDANPAALGLLGLDPANLTGRQASEVLPPEIAATMAAGGAAAPFEAAVLAASGAQVSCSCVVKLLRDELDDPVGFMILMRDIREMKRLERLSETDHLTGLANRHKMEGLLDAEIKRHDRSGEKLSVILFDLDDFKRVNDEHGHEAGDAVLVDMSRIARGALRATDTLARWGGEEFLILCPGSAASGALLLAERLRNAIRGGSYRDGARMTASFGVAAIEEGDTPELLVKRADSAMYESKRRGKDRSTCL